MLSKVKLKLKKKSFRSLGNTLFILYWHLAAIFCTQKHLPRCQKLDEHLSKVRGFWVKEALPWYYVLLKLRRQERDLVQGFEWLEILGFFVTNSVHHLPIIMELSWYALPSSWMKGQKSTMQVSYSFSFPHDFCTVKFSSHLSQFFIIKSSRRIFLLFTYTLQTFILYKV